jgi:SAM-dependent methyltransferase
MFRAFQFAIHDAWDVILRRRPPMTPSRLQNHAVGGGDFHEVGKHLAALVIDAGALQPSENILDVGCGIGRLAVPLTQYLTTGRYTGFDVSRRAIRWCQRHVSSRRPNFTFMTVDVFSSHYNPRGRTKPEEFVFPCADQSMDVVFLGSILTHLTPPAAAQYVAETARVLRPGGRAVMTFFLLDDVVRDKLRRHLIVPAFIATADPWWAVQHVSDPEAAVAYDLSVTVEALRSRGLEVTEISRGSWSDHSGSRSYQDVVVTRRNHGIRPR